MDGIIYSLMVGVVAYWIVSKISNAWQDFKFTLRDPGDGKQIDYGKMERDLSMGLSPKDVKMKANNGCYDTKKK